MNDNLVLHKTIKSRHEFKWPVLCLVAAALSASASNATEFDVKSKNLADALRQFSSQSGTDVIFQPSDLHNISAPILQGNYEVEEALMALLDGSGLTFTRDEHNVVLIKPASLSDESSSRVLDNKKDKTLEIEEITVTATKREENLQDVPLSISVLRTEEMENNGIENFQDFARQIPGVNLVQARKNRARIVIRGINTGNPDITRSQDEVATYIDEIPATSRYFANVTPDLRLFDIDRVEILRGPQGTLFGSGSLGGAVRVITKQPNTDAFETSGMMDAGITKGGAKRARYSGMVNLPLIEDELAIRAVGYYRDEEGWLTNIGTGRENANTVVDKGGRVAIKWVPSDDLKVSLMVLHQNSEPEDTDAFQADLGKFVLDTPIPNEVTSKMTFYNGAIEYDLDFATLTSSTTYARSDAESNFGFTFLADLNAPFIQKTDFFSEEVRLVSPTGGKIDWVVGGFFFDQSTDQANFIHFIDDPIAVEAQYGLTGIPADGDLSRLLSYIDGREIAGFGEVEYHLSDKLSVTGGLRWSSYKMSFIDKEMGFSFFPGFISAALSGGGNIKENAVFLNNDLKADSKSWTGKASINYQPDDDLTYYLLASRGYRVGQANSASGPDPIDPNGVFIPAQFKPDSLWNYEFGIKASLWDSKVIANLALYYIPWKDIQIAAARTTDFLTFTANAAEAESKGIELETLFYPFEHWNMGVNLTLQKAEITKVAAQESNITGAIEGDPLPNSPDLQLSGFVEYQRPINSTISGFARLDVQHVDGFRNGFSNAPGFPGTPNPGLEKTDAYENVDFNVGLEVDMWRFTAYVENLTNNDDFIRIDQVTFFPYRYNTLRPRTIGFRLQYRR